MKIVNQLDDLQKTITAWRQAGEKIAFVPTMGNLHDGHLALVERAKELGSKVVVSIFVNPTQFDRAEDLAAYPQTLQQDCEYLADLHTDLVFTPSKDIIYPTSYLRTRVEVPGISDVLEGEHRPGHFTGVATVVCKLFNLVQPDIAIFGAKDFQQLLVVKQMVLDLDIPVEIEGVTAVRETDGLAMSSRNSYLSSEERKLAPQLHQVLRGVAEKLLTISSINTMLYSEILSSKINELAELGFNPEYLTIRRSDDLQLPQEGDSGKLVILVSAWLGKARLIDNLQVCLESGEIN